MGRNANTKNRNSLLHTPIPLSNLPPHPRLDPRKRSKMKHRPQSIHLLPFLLVHQTLQPVLQLLKVLRAQYLPRRAALEAGKLRSEPQGCSDRFGKKRRVFLGIQLVTSDLIGLRGDDIDPVSTSSEAFVVGVPMVHVEGDLVVVEGGTKGEG